jgi:hypothetical protein
MVWQAQRSAQFRVLSRVHGESPGRCPLRSESAVLIACGNSGVSRNHDLSVHPAPPSREALAFFRAQGRIGGKLGGKAGGEARAAKLTAEQRSEIARKAVAARERKRRAAKGKVEAQGGFLQPEALRRQAWPRK